MSVEFCDTNVLVYAYDVTAGEKHAVAGALMERLWASGEGAVSIQVLQELYVTLTRKVARPVSAEAAREIVHDTASWRVISPEVEDVLRGIDGAARWRISFWDAMIVGAANAAGAAILWSEELNDGQHYGNVVVRNPFRANPTPGRAD